MTKEINVFNYDQLSAEIDQIMTDLIVGVEKRFYVDEINNPNNIDVISILKKLRAASRFQLLQMNLINSRASVARELVDEIISVLSSKQQTLLRERIAAKMGEIREMMEKALETNPELQPWQEKLERDNLHRKVMEGNCSCGSTQEDCAKETEEYREKCGLNKKTGADK